MPTIKCLQKRIVKFLNSSAELENGSNTNIFSRPYRDIFKYLWQLNMPDNIRIPDGNKGINRKGATESEAFRNEGNRLYKAHKFDKALLAYNYAIMTAPHPVTTFEEDGRDTIVEFCPPYRTKYPEGQHSELALAFANRSALLLEMEQNQAAMSDIHNALLFGYPYAKQYKMFERKVKCLINMEQFSEADRLAALLLANISSFDLSKNESSQLQSNLRKQISKCSSSVQSADATTTSELNTQNSKTANGSRKLRSKVIPDKEGKYWRLFYRGEDEFALTYPGATRGGDGQPSLPLAVGQSPNKGCYLRATRDIQPGELLLVETSALSFLSPGPLLRTHCSHCLRRAPAPLPCPSCSLAVFCDANCHSAAITSAGGHFTECFLLPALVALQPEVDAGLALKAATTLGLHGLGSSLEGSDQAVEENISNGQGEDSSNIATNSNGMNSKKTNLDNLQRLLDDHGKDYNFLYSLEGNHSTRTVEDRREAGITALLLVKLLLKHPLFWGHSATNFDSSQLGLDDIIKVGGQLMHIILNIQCNAHCVKELQVKPDQSLNQSVFTDLGYTLHRQLSLLNHSCAANCHLSSLGNRKLLYAVATIRKGDEVTLSYGERFVTHDKTQRRKNLEQSYFFECDCIACKQDWPLYAKLPMKFSLRCCKCGGGLDAATSKCTKCQCLHKNQHNKKNTKKGKKTNQQEIPKDLYDASSIQVLISKAWQEYIQVCANIEKIQINHKDIDKVANLLSLMDKYAHLPNKPYIEAQETCMRWYDVKASSSFTSE